MSILIFMTRLCGLLLICALGPSFAYDGPGTADFPVLRLSFDARAIGMAEAFSSVAEGASALRWNPAGLAETQGREMLLGYRSLPLDVHGGVPAFARRMGDYGVAISAEYLNYGEIDSIGETGIMDSASSRTPYSFVATAGLGRRINKKLSVGMAVRGVYEKLDGGIGSKGLGLDLGVRYLPDFRRTSLAFVVQNLGYNTTSETFSLPIVFRLGASSIFARFPKTRFGLDVVKPVEDVFDYRIGLDYHHSRALSIRAGYSITQPELERLLANSDDDSGPDRLQSWSVGAGYKMPRLTVDYALQSWNVFGLTHAVSLVFPL